MKHVIKWIIAMAMTTMLLLTSCQISGVSGADTSVSSVTVEKYGDVEIRLPGDGRGWSPAMYEVTASRSGEADVVETTTSSSLSLRLKVGSWSFVARAYDSANVMIYQSSAKTATVNESNNSAISLLLDQQSSSVKYTFAADDSLSGSINRVEISAASATLGFDIQTVTISSIDQVVTLKGLLASSAYNITVKGYINDVLYAEGSKTLNAINNTTTIKNDGAIILSQTKVTPVTSTSADGSSFSSNTAKIMLSTKTAGATIYYTTNGTTPTTSSSVYPVGGISLFNGMGAAGSKTVKAIAAAAGMSNSEVFSATYTYNPGVAATPTFSPIGGTYNDDIEVELTNNETSGSVEYSTDNTHWQTYTSKIAINGSKTEDVAQTIYARATGVTDKTDSAAVSQTYTVSYPQLALVTISPEAGQYSAEQYYTLSASVAGATIYYTTDGTEPTTSSKVYTAPFNFAADGTYTVKTFAVADKYKDSAVAVYGEYKIITSQNGGVNFKLAKALYYDSTKETWTNDEQDALFEANTSVILSGSGFTAGTEYTLTYPAGLSAAVEIYKGSDETKITGTQSAGSVTFTPPQSGKYYFVFNITESDMDNVQIVIAKSGTDIPVDAVAVTPNGASMDVGGDAVT
ncbi:MAG: chitobiase/beta-hexosaminidase C-terminal domain-containing protein, partial [Spirochaetales bacterium]|nr:chitobiase/beta-hexosaminidase C-terminal domain-containing protein [Spirochaetales bacterium]